MKLAEFHLLSSHIQQTKRCTFLSQTVNQGIKTVVIENVTIISPPYPYVFSISNSNKKLFDKYLALSFE